VATRSCAGNEFAYLAGLSSGKAEFVLVATPGHGGPRFGVILVVYRLSPREQGLRDGWVVRRGGSCVALVPDTESQGVHAGDVLLVVALYRVDEESSGFFDPVFLNKAII
jgi:hypothetical protein